MKRRLLLALVCWVLLSACERKPEQQYNVLVGDWFIYAAYREGGTTDLLPLADMFGYSCLGTSVLRVDEQTFNLESSCDVLACHGTYACADSIIYGVTSEGDTLSFYFVDGVLSTIQDIDVLGRLDLRFQKR